MKKNSKGFTLVELVITIAIVIILSVVSVPIYRGYTDKAKMAEGYSLLGLILSAQKSYFSEYGNFLKSVNSSSGADKFTANETVLGIDARGNKYFTSFFVGYSGIDHSVYFRAAVIKPESLRSNADNSYLVLRYWVTSGATYNEVWS